MHQIFKEKKEETENSTASQSRRREFTTNDKLIQENKRLRQAKEGLWWLLESAEERIEAAHAIREVLEQEAVVSKEVEKSLDKLYQQSQREKAPLEEVNQQLLKEKMNLEQELRQYQQEKTQLLNDHQMCDMKIRTLKTQIEGNTDELDIKTGYIRALEESDEMLRRDCANFERELQDLKKESAEKISRLEQKVRAEKNLRDKVDQQLEREGTEAKKKDEKLNYQIRQLQEATAIIEEELGTERSTVLELTEDNEKLNETVLTMRKDLGSLTERWGIGTLMSNSMLNNNVPASPVAGARTALSMSISKNSNIQRNPVTPSKNP
jgi:DNA repair exonuclease SbcCD ATPase subunit